MNRRELLLQIAPCGLDCGRCLNNQGSPIARQARALRACLGNFGAMAERFAAVDPVFAKYPAFESMLQRFCAAGCTGCREGLGAVPQCTVKNCVRDKGLDFCHECAQFPCVDPGLPPSLRALWQQNNQRIQEVGFSTYLGEIRAKPRY